MKSLVTKKEYIFKLCSIIFLLFGLMVPIKSLAANLELTCIYDAGVVGFEGTAELTYKVYSDGTTELPFKKNANLLDARLSWQAKYTSESFAKTAKIDGGYKCPDISTDNNMNFVSVHLGNLSGNGTQYKLATLKKEIVSKKENEIKKTKECVFKIFADSDNKLDFDIDLKLTMYSNGDKTFSINENEAKVNEPVFYKVGRHLESASFVIKEEEVASLFIQPNFQMVEKNLFTCPTYIYALEDSLTDRQYNISTKKGNYDYYSKAYDEETYDPNNEDDIVVDPFSGKPVNCSDFTTKEGSNMIQDIFNLIMLIAPILVIVLGGLDFAKASLQSDEDAIKKAGINFGKRLIAAVLLFLLPLIINIVLEIAFDAGVLESIPEICIDN